MSQKVRYHHSMHITWHGQFTLKIQTQETTILIDPYSPNTGLRPLKLQADVIVISNTLDNDMSHESAVHNQHILLSGPGEYNVNGFTLHATAWKDDQRVERTIQQYIIENITIFNAASLNRELTSEELQVIKKIDVDVLFLPVGGGSALDYKQAVKFITIIEPRMVIPIHFKLPKLKEKLDSVDLFSKEMGLKTLPAENKIIIKQTRLPKEDMEVVILEP